MSCVRVFCLLTALLSGAASAGALDDYLALATGSFTSAAQAATDSRYDEVTWHIREIWPDSPGEARWLYTESWMADAQAPYMQRISSVVERSDGSLLTRRFRLPDASAYVGAWQDPERFSALDPDSLVELTGCEAVMVRAGEQRFEGGTRGRDCANRYKGASYAISRGVLHADGMTNWDRGFSDTGALVWGPAHGGYRFRRVGEASACVKPVRMLVYGEIDDRKAFGAYARAIAESGLYEANRGLYEATTPALEVFEGDPPANRGVVIARFPCLEAARSFWYSDEYAKIRPLRAGISRFEVLVLPAQPLPAWAE
jgi:uncharacterized protein (DUF1330 family)